MSTTFMPTSNMENGFTIVTHVIPAQTAPAGAGQNGPESGAGFCNRLLARNTRHDHSTPGSARPTLPQVLGTVQIMTGAMSFLLAIVLSQHHGTHFFSQSLHGYWGSIIYISAGALSVAAQNKFRRCLVKSSLAVNAVSAVTAGIATILLSLDLAYGLDGLFMSSMGHDCRFSYYCDFFMSRTNGISGVLLVFSLLQFIVSICMSLFGLDATCCAEPEVRTTSQFPSCGACISLNNPCSAHSNEEGVFVISNPNMSNSPLTRPPEYSEIEPQFQP